METVPMSPITSTRETTQSCVTPNLVQVDGLEGSGEMQRFQQTHNRRKMALLPGTGARMRHQSVSMGSSALKETELAKVNISDLAGGGWHLMLMGKTHLHKQSHTVLQGCEKQTG